MRRALDPLVGEAYVIGATVEVGHVQVAEPPVEGTPMAPGEYAFALTPELLYMARLDSGSRAPGPQQQRLRLVEATMAMAFGGPPFHATLHLEHPATGRLVISLPEIEFARRTELTYLVATGVVEPRPSTDPSATSGPGAGPAPLPNPIPKLRSRLRPRRAVARPPGDTATH